VSESIQLPVRGGPIRYPFDRYHLDLLLAIQGLLPQKRMSPRGYPGYLSLMESDFDRAGEDAWLVGLAYDFERLGLRGLSAFFNFARGTGARDPANGQALPDEREYDLTVDYRVARKGWLEGLWLRLRGAVLESGDNTQTEVRLILNYAFPVL
jgi:hypothetical protein